MIDLTKLKGTKQFQGDSWFYFPPKEYEALSDEHKDQLFYLDKDSTELVYNTVHNFDILCGDDDWGNKPFSAGCYEEVIKIEKWSGDEELKKWLYNRGVPFKSEVLIVPIFGTEDACVLLSTWKMIAKYADNFFCSDNIIVADPELKWCLHYHHDEIIHFAKGRDFTSSER